jgi:hypothetical protein
LSAVALGRGDAWAGLAACRIVLACARRCRSLSSSREGARVFWARGAWEEALCWVPLRIWHVRGASALPLALARSLLRMQGEIEVYVGRRGRRLRLTSSGGLLHG